MPNTAHLLLAEMYHGKDLVIINKGKTKMEGKADLVFHNKISEILEQVSDKEQ